MWFTFLFFFFIVPVYSAVLQSKPDFISPEVPPNQRVPSSCVGQCRFSLCDGRGELTLARPDSPLTSAICEDQLGSITIASTGEARILFQGSHIPISKIPGHNMAPFPASFFKTVFKGARDGSAVTHQTLQPGQGQLLNNRCVQLPVKRYIYDSFFSNDVENRIGSNPLIDCIGFKVIVPRILVKLEWSGNDDLDLEMIPPKGKAINFRNSKTDLGILLNDDKRDACGKSRRRAGIEKILIKGDKILLGKYKARVRLFARCNRDVQFRIEIYIDGILRQLSTGSVSQDDKSIVADYDINLSRQ